MRTIISFLFVVLIVSSFIRLLLASLTLKMYMLSYKKGVLEVSR